MCNPAMAMMAVGTAMQYGAQRQATKRAGKQLAAGEDRNDAFNQRILNTISKNADQYNAVDRLAANDETQSAAVASLGEYLNQAREAGMGKINDSTQGRVSNAYLSAKAKRNVIQAKNAAVLARLMGQVRAPSDLRIHEGLQNANAAAQTGTLANQQRAMANATQVDVSGAAIPNAGMMLAGGLMSGYGMGKAMAPRSTVVAGSQPSYGVLRSDMNRRPSVPRSLFN